MRLPNRRDFFQPPFPCSNRAIVTGVERNFAPLQGVGELGTSVLISILITFLVIVLVLYLIGMLPVDARAKQIARIVVIIIGIISMLKYLAVF